MNFDDLSARWQQQTPALVAPPSPEALRALLSGPSGTPVGQMRRNVWAEVIGSLLFGLLVLAGVRAIDSNFLNRLVLALLPLYAGVAYYYFRTFRVLSQLRGGTGALNSHVAGQLRHLRQLLRLYYWATLLPTLVVLGLMGLGVRHVLPSVPAAQTTCFLSTVVVSALIGVGLVHWLTRHHLQYAYGQHLDRLEAVLRELGDEAPGPAAA